MGNSSNVDGYVDGLQEYSTRNDGNIPILSDVWKKLMMNPLRALSPEKYVKGGEKKIIDRKMVEEKQKTMKERHEAKHEPRGPEIQKGDGSELKDQMDGFEIIHK